MVDNAGEKMRGQALETRDAVLLPSSIASTKAKPRDELFICWICKIARNSRAVLAFSLSYDDGRTAREIFPSRLLGQGFVAYPRYRFFYDCFLLVCTWKHEEAASKMTGKIQTFYGLFYVNCVRSVNFAVGGNERVGDLSR
jgi:hypothetical protein